MASNISRVTSLFLLLGAVSAACTFGASGTGITALGETGHESEAGEVGDDDVADDTTTGDTPPEDCEPPEGGFFAAEDQDALVPHSGLLELGVDPGTLGTPPAQNPANTAFWGIWAPGALCEDLRPAGPSAPRMRLRIYRPQTMAGTTPGEWPDGRFPVLVFHHGVAGDPTLYDHVFRPLIEDGFIVANVNATADESNEGGGFDETNAAAAMACAVRYVAQEGGWDQVEHIGCGMALAGHSRGAEAAVLALGPIAADGILTVAALVGLAGRHNIGTVPPEFTVPFLALASASDDDVLGDPISAYDRMGYESPPQGAPKVILRAYDVPHSTLGGTSAAGFQGTDEMLGRSGLTGAQYMDKGHAYAASYTRAFLRRHLLDRDLDAYEDLFSLRDFPPEVVDPTWWDYLDAYGELAGGFQCGSRNEGSCAAAQGCEWNDPDCEDFECGGINEVACRSARGCAWDGTSCENQPVIVAAWTDPRLPATARARVDALEGVTQFETNLPGPGPAPADSHEIGPAASLAQGVCEPPIGEAMACETYDTRSFIGPGHDTNGLRLEGNDTADGYVRWSLEELPDQPIGPLNGLAFTHARMRVGVRSELVDDPFNSAADCMLTNPDAWSVSVELGSGSGPRRIDLRPLIQQEAIWSQTLANGPPLAPICAQSFFMQTVEVSLREFCAAPGVEPFSVEDLRDLAILVPAANGPGDVVVDSIELVAEPGREPDLCDPPPPGMFACAADEGLEITLTSCTTAPTSGQCPSQYIVQSPLDPPEVPAEWGGPFEGFVVHVPAGWITDAQQPSVDELALVTERCQVACQQHYANDPHVTATCDASGAFATPTLVTGASTGAVPRIPTRYEYGSNLWPYGPQSLACNLESDCCEAFDEDVCQATANRPTPEGYPLGSGAEWLIELEGSLHVMSLDDEVDHSATVTGTVGSSQCSTGSDEAPCPFYLGSLHVELTESLPVEILCGETPLELELGAMQVDLVAPAMGIDFEDNFWKAFPPGALRLRSQLEIGPIAIDHVESNQRAVFVNAGDAWLDADGDNGLKVHFDVPCAGQAEPMVAWLDLEGGAPIGYAPQASIDMPSSVICGTSVDLDVIATDGDFDIASIRWEVDGVLLDASIQEIEISASHEISARVRDSRGATASDVHTIACTPP